MKTQIRRNIFETNSSSTHTLTLVKADVETVLSDVIDTIIKKYNNFTNDYGLCIDDFLKDNNTLLLKGFHTESGEEEKVISYIIKTPLAKIQYLFMILIAYQFYVKDINKVELDYFTDNDIRALKNTEVYKSFINKILEYCKTHTLFLERSEIKIENIESDDFPEYSICIEYMKSDFISNIENEKEITKEYFDNLFDIVMDDNFIALYQDIAYLPCVWTSPEVYIY